MSLTVRAATIEDAPMLDVLLDTCTRTYTGRATVAGDAATRLALADWAAWLVEESDSGAVVGFGHAWPFGYEARCFARVHPDHRRRGVATMLLNRLERRAESLVPAAPGAHMTATSWDADEAAPPLLRARGFRELRYFVRMTNADPVEPVEPPAGIRLRPFAPGREESALFRAWEEAFAEHFGLGGIDEPGWWAEHRDDPGAGFDPELWTLAWDGDDLAGFCIARERPGAAGRPEGYVGDIGVRPPWRGRGIGHALLTASLAGMRRRGLERITLDVDADNVTGALRLYRKAGMQAEPAFTVWTRPLVA